jgi:non-heme chloroperoxidase
VVRPALEQRPSSALLSYKIVKGAQLKIYKGAPQCTAYKDEVNAELLAFIEA